MPTILDEQAIINALRQVPAERWGDVLSFLDALRNAEPPIRTGEDLIRSPLVGLWADRDDLGDGREYARELRLESRSLGLLR